MFSRLTRRRKKIDEIIGRSGFGRAHTIDGLPLNGLQSIGLTQTSHQVSVNRAVIKIWPIESGKNWKPVQRIPSLRLFHFGASPFRHNKIISFICFVF